MSRSVGSEIPARILIPWMIQTMTSCTYLPVPRTVLPCNFYDRYAFSISSGRQSLTITVNELCHSTFILDPEDLIDLTIGTHCLPEPFNFEIVNPQVVMIDIKPGNDSNTINLGSNGNVPVAILGSANFDAATVNPATITLADAPVKTKGGNNNSKKVKGNANDSEMTSIKDVNGDGYMDLLVHILTSGMQVADSDVTVLLKGYTFDGVPIAGTDTVRVVP